LPPPPAQPPVDAAAEQRRQQELEAQQKAAEAERAELKATLEAVSAELTAEREQRAEEVIALQERLAAAETVVKQARETPPVTSARLGLGLTGYVQADYNAWRQSSEDQLDPASGNPINDERFLIRRARLRATLERWYVAGALEFDGNTVNGATARIIGAEASLKWPPERGTPPLLMATVGMFKIPFGFEVGESDRVRLFLERSTAERALFPGEYDLGARLMGGWRFMRYALAVQNGEPVGERGGFPARDPNSAKDVTGRIGVETPVTPEVSLAGGFSGLSGTGFHPGTPATKAVVQWMDRNGNGAVDPGEIIAVPAMAAAPSRNFSRFGYGADLRVAVAVPGVGTTTAYGEIYIAKNLDRGILPADPYGPLNRASRELGGYAALIQEIGAHLAVGVRYDYYNPDLDSSNLSMGALVPQSFAYQTIAAVAALRGPAGRLIVEYDHNRNNLGRDSQGNPANRQDDMVTVRGEASF
jgi:hypothetical protein